MLTATLFLFCYALGIFFFAIRIRPEDQKTYSTLIEESDVLCSKRAFEKKPAMQQRFDVQKDIWTLDGVERSHARLNSRDSTLTLRQRGKKFKAEEKLQGVSGWMQEKKSQISNTGPIHLQADGKIQKLPSQFLTHHLEADKATYDGKTLSLNGAFHLTHPMGNLRSISASIEGLGIKNQPIHIFLDQQVQIDLPASEKRKQPIFIRSDRASSTLAEQHPFSFLSVQTIQFQKNVYISGSENMEAHGGLALYKKKQNVSTITLYPTLPLLYCQLLYDEISLHAETIEFLFTGEKPQLAQISTTGDSEIFLPSNGYLLCKGPLLYHPENNVLSASPQTPLQFTSDTLYLEADRARIAQPDKTLILEGNIRLISSQFQNKETYAIAETARYCAEENLLILNGSPGRKVLFWQDGFTFTAPEIHIRKDPETVQGVGDIHFTFDLDEQDYFEQIFSKYL